MMTTVASRSSTGLCGRTAISRATVTIASPISILVSTPKTRRPFPKAIYSVTLGAWNFSGVSMKDRPKVRPNQIKDIATSATPNTPILLSLEPY